MKLQEKFRRAINAIKEALDPDRIKLDQITARINVDPQILNRMSSEKGWEIVITDSHTFMDPNQPDTSMTITVFSATKDGQQEGIILWYDDLCDVTGIPHEKAVNTVRNVPKPPRML